MIIMAATFAQWLKDQENRDDGPGQVARWWASHEGKRPKASAPDTIRRWLREHDREVWDNQGGKAAWEATIAEFRASRERHLALVPERPDQAMVTLGAIQQALTQILSVQLMIAEKLGIENIETASWAPEPVTIAEATETAGEPGWPELAAMAQYGEEEAGDG
jgi:hypothetical protein